MSDEVLALKWWGVVLGLLLATTAILTAFDFGLWSTYLPWKTRVERRVFEESYQRQAGLEAKVATLEAQADALRIELTNPDLTPTDRTNLTAQLSALDAQIRAAKAQQKD